MPTKNEVPFSAEKRKRVTCAYITELSYTFSCEYNIFGPTQMTFLERKRKWKFPFGRKRKSRKWPNPPFSAPKMFGRLLVWWIDLTDPDPLRFYDRSTPLPVLCHSKWLNLFWNCLTV